MVIVAGYKEDVEQKFFTMNKGLESRFIWRFTISPYSHEELYQIFQLKIKNIGWTLDENTYNKWLRKIIMNLNILDAILELAILCKDMSF